jgi:drug/metabolite transporter (DMT)-like permease
LLAIRQKAFQRLKELTFRDYLLLILFGLIEIASTTFFFKAIHAMPNPSVVAFMGNLGPVFVLILGFFILKERFNRWEVAGILITLSAAFMLSYNSKWIHFNEMFIDGSLYVLLFTSLFAVSSILMKLNVIKFSPVILSLNRIIFLLTFSLLIKQIQG